MKDIDWSTVVPAVLIALLGGAALGTFVVRPAMDKAKAKKLAAKGDDKSKKG